MTPRLEVSFFAEDFKGAEAEDAVACDPAGAGGEDGGADEGDGGSGPVDVETDLHAVKQDAGEQVGEDDSHDAGQQSENAEFHAEDADDPHAGGAQGLEHDSLAHAAEAGAGNGRGQDGES